ncbi:MAG: BofC C-terminal domain-containing protein [Ruminococcus sp.]|nr:BofC C-terminal domain-containing protein [Ruminococcus sp.]
MIDRKIFFTLVGSVTVSGFIVICTLGQSLHHQKVEAKVRTSLYELEKVEFIVREYEGKLGVFRGESETPYRIIDCNVSLLSEYDRQQLRTGIVIESDEELNSFIEDMST